MNWYHSLAARAAVALTALTLLLGAAPRLALAGPAAQGQIAPSYSFAEMGLGIRELSSPADRQGATFSLPAGQQVAEGARLDLVLRTSLIDATPPEDRTANLGGVIRVRFNDALLAELPLTAEPERELSLDIPAEALALAPGERYSVTVELQTQADCVFGNAIRVAVGEESRLTLPTEAAPIGVDLRALPQPLYQRSFLPESALLVVPDEPTADELRAAMLVAAGLGRQTGGRLLVELRRSSDLTAAEYEASHLVFVGPPSKLPLLGEVTLPAAVQDGVFAAPSLGADDGVIQAAISPWNEARLALAIGGNSPAGLDKAARAFVMGQYLVSEEQPALALIAALNPPDESMPAIDRSFAELGYPDTRRIGSPGVSSLYYQFDMPVDQVATEEAFVELAFTHAAGIDFEQSGFTVVLNGSEIGGVGFSQETVQLSRASFTLPGAALRPGRNEIQIRATLTPRDQCVAGDALDLWMNIWPDSQLSLPLEPAPELPLRSVSLDAYPDIFTASPTLASTALVVGAGDTNSWQVAANIAASLAGLANNPPVDLGLAFDGALSDEQRERYNLVLIGQPSQLALIGELNDSLPAPFEANSDVAVDRISQVAFRLTEQEDVGYLQLVSAPANDQRFVLGVLGNSPAGVAGASQALTRGDLRSRLGGSFAIVVDQQVFIGGTRLAVSAPPAEATPAPAGAAPGGSTVITDTTQPVLVDPNVDVPRSSPPLLLALVGSVAVMLAVVGAVVGWSFYQRRRQSR